MQRLGVLLATAGGLGYVPVAPGTIGSLAAVPLLPALAALRARSAPLCAGVLLLLIAVAVWAAGCAEEAFASADHPRIVVDEVAGLALAGLFLPATWAAAGLAFVLFRAFDVLKPFPAGWIDRRLHGGIGVVGDDLVAGLYAGVASRLLIGVP